MKRFLFRLERVLHLRESVEKERARDLGNALREEAREREAREAAAEHLERCGEQARSAEGEATPAGTLRNRDLAVEAAARELESAERRHAEAERAVEQEQQRYGQARQDRRVLERLREQRHEAWARDAAREDQTQNDGVARERHAKGNRP